MVKFHLKRLAIPKTWPLARKEVAYALRPHGSGHQYNRGLPLVSAFRDILDIADSVREVRYMLNHNKVFVDGRQIKDHKFLIGLFDVISSDKSDDCYRVIMTDKKRIDIIEVDKKESNIKLKKIVGKTIIKKGQIQLNFNDGSNIISDIKCVVGDSVVFDFTKKEIKEVLPIVEKAPAMLLSGQYMGTLGLVEKVMGGKVALSINEKSYETKKENLIILGTDKPVITCSKKIEG